ncbi:hypothetical protein [Mycobacterium sp. NPDC050041]|uniref:hypothetical protein n=1 Tax=Mycobacterium sp. NPDC050041 TaxID=3364293 RepID=UPI003C2E7A9A
MLNPTLTAAVVATIAVTVLAPTASAEPDVYGLLTADEKQEIFANGQRNCVSLDRAAEASPPLSSDDVRTVIDSYVAGGWDLESAGDIVWESVEGRCAEYMPQVKIAMRSYGDPS